MKNNMPICPIEYDRWYDENRNLYWPEILVLRKIIKKEQFGLEIGVGTGRFALPLDVDVGIDPSPEMLQIARKRGLEVIEGKGESMPFKCCVFDYILITTTICFLHDIENIFNEAKRVMRKRGKLIIGMIPKHSMLGKYHLKNKEKSLYFKNAIFRDVEEVVEYLKTAGFNKINFLQTLIGYPEEKRYNKYSRIEKGFDRGSFVVIKAKA